MHSQASQRNFSLKQDELSEHAPVQQGRDQFIRKPQTNLIQRALSVHTEHFYSCSVLGFLQHRLSSLQHLKTCVGKGYMKRNRFKSSNVSKIKQEALWLRQWQTQALLPASVHCVAPRSSATQISLCGCPCCNSLQLSV